MARKFLLCRYGMLVDLSKSFLVKARTKRIAAMLAGWLTAFATHCAGAGQMLALEVSGNDNKTVLAMWNPGYDDTAPGSANGEFTTTIMLDTEECARNGKPCPMKATFKGPLINLATPWTRFGYLDFFGFSNNKIDFRYHFGYDVKSSSTDPDAAEYPVFIGGVIQATFDMQ